MTGLDTNVLLRFMLRDDTAQAAAADRFVESSCTPDDPCLVNRATLCELVWVLSRFYRYRREDIARAVELILRADSLRVEDERDAWNALLAFRAYRADFADCLVGESNLGLGCDATVTFDRDAAKMPSYRLLPDS